MRELSMLNHAASLTSARQAGALRARERCRAAQSVCVGKQRTGVSPCLLCSSAGAWASHKTELQAPLLHR